MENKPKKKDKVSDFDFDFKLNPMKIGRIGNMQGDNIEITPVKKENKGTISIKSPKYNQ